VEKAITNRSLKWPPHTTRDRPRGRGENDKTRRPPPLRNKLPERTQTKSYGYVDGNGGVCAGPSEQMENPTKVAQRWKQLGGSPLLVN